VTRLSEAGQRKARWLVVSSLVPGEVIERQIYLIRGQKVMLSTHLAQLYGVEPRVLIQAVKRNQERFPADFLFQLNAQEFENLKSQIVISSWGGPRRAAPYAFTEHGVAMLSSVLKSKRAIQVNIAIVRAFVRLREVLATHKDLARKVDQHDRQIKTIFKVLEQLLEPPPERRRQIGFAPAAEGGEKT
jgi:phage regulator Rha-like protein